MKRIVPLLSILTLILTMAASVVYAQEPEPPTPLPPKDGAVSGSIVHTVEVTIGEDGIKRGEGERGRLEETVHRFVVSPALDQTVTWTQRSTLQYYDYGNYEDVQGKSDNWTDTPVYMLRALGEVYRNGDRLWDNTVTNYNTTYVSSSYSPYYRGDNAFWQSKGTHWMKVTSSSPTDEEHTEVSRQF